VGLALFDSNLTDDIKDQMVKAMNEVDGTTDPLKRVKLNPDFLSDLNNKTLADFTTKNTRTLFTQLDLPQGFLDLPASQWEEHEHYQTARRKLSALAVINDHAERGVALVQDFSGKLTKDEDQLQFILQVVAEHRKRYPEALKKNFVGPQ